MASGDKTQIYTKPQLDNLLNNLDNSINNNTNDVDLLKLKTDNIGSNIVTKPILNGPNIVHFNTSFVLTASGSLTGFKDNGAVIDYYKWTLPNNSTAIGNSITYTSPVDPGDNSEIPLSFICKAVDTLGNESDNAFITVTATNNFTLTITDLIWNNEDHSENNSYTVTINTTTNYNNPPPKSYTLTSNPNTNITITQDGVNPNVFHVTYGDILLDTTYTFTATVSDIYASDTYNESKLVIADELMLTITDITWDQEEHYENYSYTATINTTTNYSSPGLSYTLTSNPNTNITITQDGVNPNVFHVTYGNLTQDTNYVFTATASDIYASNTYNESKLVHDGLMIGQVAVHHDSSSLALSQIREYSIISTLGNATSFGSLSNYALRSSSTSNGINDRNITQISRREYETYKGDLLYSTISTLSNSSIFGYMKYDESSDQWDLISNGTNDRCVGMPPGAQAHMYYITISTLGNGYYFGDLMLRVNWAPVLSNATDNRGIKAGGYKRISMPGGYYFQNSYTIQYITISTLGNSINFGNIIRRRGNGSGTSNGIGNRGILNGGVLDGIFGDYEYITINTLCNGLHFGDLSIQRFSHSSTSNGVNNRAIISGGDTPGGYTKDIEYITINTLCNGLHFGTLTHNKIHFGSASNA